MKVFDLQGNGTNFVAEILAGITTFITMSYLLVQYPALLGGNNPSAGTAHIAMCLTCFIGCMVMGFLAKQPFVVGPSVGLTVFFISTLMKDLGYSYSQALTICFVAGLIFVGLSFAGINDMIYSSLPGSMKNSISAGLGIYIAMIGLKNSGFLTVNDSGSWQIADLSKISLTSFTVLVMFAGLIFIGLFKKLSLPFPPLLGLLASGAIYFGGGYFLKLVDPISLKPAFGSFNDQFGSWYSQGFLVGLTKGIGDIIKGMSLSVKPILTIVLTVLVCAMLNATESVSVVYAIAKNNGKLDDKGNFGKLKTTVASNAIATTVGSLVGSPMVSVVPESSAGICAQGKSGLTAVTAGVFFLLAAFFTPVATVIPAAVTACVMVYLGVTMLGTVKEIDFGNLGESIPALITIILIPFTSSIIDGIALGLIAHIVINLILFNFKTIKPLELVIAALFSLSYFLV